MKYIRRYVHSLYISYISLIFSLDWYTLLVCILSLQKVSIYTINLVMKESVIELRHFDVSWDSAYSPTDFRRWCENGNLGRLYSGSVVVKVDASSPCGSCKRDIIDSLIVELEKYKEDLKDE